MFRLFSSVLPVTSSSAADENVQAASNSTRAEEKTTSDDWEWAKSTNPKDKVIIMSPEEYQEPITNGDYLRIQNLSVDELDDHYNPGPTKPDGSVNFECHCVGHLVASPCGYEFRRAITCQKSTSEEELDKAGACADEFMDFIGCIMRTKCFRSSNPTEDLEDDDEDGDILNDPDMDEIMEPEVKEQDQVKKDES